MDRVIFQPVYCTWDFLNQHYYKPAMAIQEGDLPSKKVAASLANLGKLVAFGVTYAIATIAAVLFSLISWPIRAYQLKRIHNISLKDDLNRLSPQEHDILNREIRAYIAKKSSKGLKIDADKVASCIEKVKASYARSRDVYAPVAVKWVDHLLNKAEANGQKLVFMARDGAAPFKLAQNMMKEENYKESFPGLTQEGRIVMGYFSRKVVANSYSSVEDQEIFKKYLVNELGIKPGDNCLFVDIGFHGSMIDRITEMASNLNGIQAAAAPATRLSNSRVSTRDVPADRVKVNFEYLISLTTKATGYLATDDYQLESVHCSGKNLGVHWLEDSHQGVIESPTKLIKHSNGHIYPDTLKPGHKKTCIDKGEEFLLRRFSTKAITDAHLNIGSNGDWLKIKGNFDRTLIKIKAGEMPLLF
jgi:hypothetical protein